MPTAPLPGKGLSRLSLAPYLWPRLMPSWAPCQMLDRVHQIDFVRPRADGPARAREARSAAPARRWQNRRARLFCREWVRQSRQRAALPYPIMVDRRLRRAGGR